jgi:ubiquinone/menaquinone biosynthesis C-methylase UbiE
VGDYSRADVYTGNVSTEPKHMFKWLVDHGADLGLIPGSVLDVGAATGAFQRYVLSRFPESSVVGLEYDAALVEAAQTIPDTGQLIQGDANDLSVLNDAMFDCVFMTGVHSIFDDLSKVLDQCLAVCRPGGAVVVTGLFNDHPLDARIVWRYPNKPEADWHPGYNLFSKETVATILGDDDRVKSHSFAPFRMPFPLEPQSDPVRSWTYEDGTDETGFALRNGLMPLNMQRLTIWRA